MCVAHVAIRRPLVISLEGGAQLFGLSLHRPGGAQLFGARPVRGPVLLLGEGGLAIFARPGV